MTAQSIEELIRKYAEGTATKVDIEELMNWYRSLPINDVKWPSAGENERQELSGRMLNRLLTEITPQRRRIDSMQWLKVAAVLIPAIGIALFFFLRPESKQYITILNPSGQVKLVSLPDGSRVWLNAATKLRYRESFTDHREIILDGEAFFDVHRDLQHPFTINGGNVTTTVLGTSFNVKAYESDTVTVVTVVTGRVGVKTSSMSRATLTPAGQLHFNRVSKTASTKVVDTIAALAWRKGKLSFDGQSLAEISKTIEYWYGVSIVFRNPAMRNCRYYMSFENTITLDTLLSTMSELTRMKYIVDVNKKVVELSGEGCQ